MNRADAQAKSRDGVAERKDIKGQRWSCWIKKPGDGGSAYIYKSDGSMLPLTLAQCDMLKDWQPKDPMDKLPRRIWP